MTISIRNTLFLSQFFTFWYRCNYLLVFVIILSSFEVKSQSEGNLNSFERKELEKKHDSISYELFKKYRLNDKEKAKHYATEAFKISSKYQHYLIQSKACRALAYLYNVDNQLDSTRIYLYQGIKISSKHNLTSSLIDLYNDLGLFNERLDVYDSALHYFMLSYNMATQSLSYKAQTIACSNLGLVYSYLENYSQAIAQYKLAIQIGNDNGITQGLNLNLINLARILNEQGRYKDAIINLKKVELNCKKDCDETILADLYYEFGYSYLTGGFINEAYEYFTKALTLARNTDNKQTIANALYHLSSFSINNKAYDDALKYLQESEKIAQQINHRRLLRDIYQQFSTLYNKTGIIDKELHYQKRYAQLKDSIFNQSIANNVKNILLRDQDRKSNAVIVQKETALSKSYILIALLILNTLLAFTVIFLVYRALISSRRHREAMELHVVKMLDHRQNSEQQLFRTHMEFTALQSRVTGFLNGPVLSLKSLANLIKKSIRLEDLKEATDKMVRLCNDILIVLNNANELILYKNHDVAIEEIDINILSQEINKNFKKLKRLLLLTINIEPSVRNKINSDKELLLTAINHAIQYFDNTSENPVVELIFSQYENDPITRIAVKHYSTYNRQTPYKNQFNHLTVMVASGKLGGEFLLTQFEDHTLIEIFIPTDFAASTSKTIRENISLE